MKILKKARSLILLAAVTLCSVPQVMAQAHKPQVTKAEYFIDTDLGEGNNTALNVEDGKWGDALETAIKSGISLTRGMHKLGVRVKDSLAWSPVFVTIVSVENKIAVTHDMTVSAGELFWDQDPGQGKGTAFLAFDGNFNSAIETLVYRGSIALSAGKHKLSVRVKDKQGIWGPVFSSIVSIEQKMSAPKVGVVSAQLFWDKDTTSAISLVAIDGNLNDAVESVLGSAIMSPPVGLHALSIRVKDAKNQWSQAFRTVVSIENKLSVRTLKIAQAEVFIDNDPGEGNGKQLVAFDGNFNDAIETVWAKITDYTTVGTHRLCVRVKDADGKWSPVFTTVLSVDEKLAARKMNIASGEVFWDNDPGEGNATSFIAFDGVYNDAFETVRQSINSAAIGTGHHTISCRVRDSKGTWGPVFKTVIFIDECTSKPTSTITVAGSKTSFCQGDSVKLTASSGTYKYRWVLGGKQLADTAQYLYAKESGYYKAIVIDQDGCPGASTPTVINVIPLNPKITASREPVLCQGESVGLSVTNGYESYTWSNGSTNSYVSTSTEGLYKVTVTNKGCSRYDSVQVVVNPVPTEPIIIADGSTTFCQGDSVNISTSADFPKYLWSNGATTKSVKIEKSGYYYVTVTNTFGCKAYATTPVGVSVINSKPYIYSIGTPVVCQGDSIKLYTTGNFSSYVWSTGDTTASVYVKNGDSYTLTVTYNTCVGYSDAFTVQVNPDVTVPQITASDTTTFCEGGSVNLTSSVTTDIQWNTGSTNSAIDVKSSGTYYVTARNQYGCAATSAPVTVNVLSLTPQIKNSRPLSFCAGDSTVLSAGKGYSTYKWSTGATSESIVVKTSGSYSVTITNSLCGASEGMSAPVTVTVNPSIAKPVVSQDGSLNMCSGQKLILTSSPAYSYQWGGGSIEQSLSVVNAGTYFVKAYNEYGCSASSDSISVNIYPQPAIPDVVASASTSFCKGDSIKLTTNAGSDFMWSNGATTPSIYVKESGSYYVNVVSAEKCKAQSQTIDVLVTDVDPTVFASGPTAFCQGDSVSLSVGDTFDSYVWSNGSTLNETTVKTSDVYSVTMTKNGCTTVSQGMSVTAWLPPAVPVISANDTTTFCSADSVILTTDQNFKYTWSNNSKKQSIVVYNSGSYSVTVEDDHGCIASSDDELVTVLPTPKIPVITIMKGSHDFCVGDSVLLSSDEEYSYSWSTGDTSRQVWVQESGLYYVSVTNKVGCENSSDYTQLVKHNLPDATLIPSAATTFCTGDSITLATGMATTYSWNTKDSTRTVVAKKSGYYDVVVADEWGCTDRDSIEVVVNPLPVAEINYTGSTVFCTGDSLVLTANNQFAYQWSNNKMTQQIVAKSTGTYTVTVATELGCKNSASVTITVNPKPTANVTTSGSTTICEGQSLALTASTNATYLWSTGDATKSVKVYSAGDYVVTVTNQFGCEAISTPTTVVVNPVPDATISASSATEFCDGDSTTLSVAKTALYSWSTGDSTGNLKVKTSGTYKVTTTNEYGCSDTKQVSIVANPIPTATIATSGSTTFCEGKNVMLTASPGADFLWSNGETGRSVTASTSGDYVVTVYNQYGCKAASNPVTVVSNAIPDATILLNGNSSFCEGDSVQLSVADASAYVWNTRDSVSSITVKKSGVYRVTSYNAIGCSDSKEVAITMNPIPIVSIAESNPTTFCQGDSVTLTATKAVSYLWSTGDISQVIKVKRSLKTNVVITDANGCKAESDSVSVEVSPILDATIVTTGNTDLCVGDSVMLDAGVARTYYWNTGDTIRTLKVTKAGQYVVTVTNAEQCSARSEIVTVALHSLPVEPVLSQSHDTLVVTPSQSRATYHWYKDTELVGATSDAFRKTSADGTYSVAIEDYYGCENKSIDFVYVVPTGVNAVEASEIAVYPNPSTGLVNFRLDIPMDKNVMLLFIDELGQILPFSPEISGNVIGVNASNLPSGLYTYVIKSADKVIARGHVSLVK